MALDLLRGRAGSDEDGEHHPPWMTAVRIGVPVAVVGILLAIKPEIAEGTFSSAESVARVAAVIAAWVLFSWLMRRVIPNPVVRSVAVAVPAAILLWVNVAPYFKDDVKIASSFPDSFTTATPSPTPGAGGPDPYDNSAAPAPTAPAQPAQPVQLTTGQFRGLDGHRGSGEASIFRQPDGSHVVAFRNLSVSSVPDPVLYLVPGADRDRQSGGVKLGAFSASKDRYEIPAGTDLKGPLTVLIWCERFSVPVAGATQAQA